MLSTCKGGRKELSYSHISVSYYFFLKGVLEVPSAWLGLLNIIYFYFNFMSMSALPACMDVYLVPRGARSLELELQTISATIWVLETELRWSARALNALKLLSQQIFLF